MVNLCAFEAVILFFLPGVAILFLCKNPNLRLAVKCRKNPGVWSRKLSELAHQAKLLERRGSALFKFAQLTIWRLGSFIAIWQVLLVIAIAFSSLFSFIEVLKAYW